MLPELPEAPELLPSAMLNLSARTGVAGTALPAARFGQFGWFGSIEALLAGHEARSFGGGER